MSTYLSTGQTRLATTPAIAALQFSLGLLRLPFDSARAQYAQAVRAGLVQRSMLASRDFELALGAMEQATLGPLARRV
jgi:hypothetical protein